MTNRRVLIVGATGLIGAYCLQELLDDPCYSEVIALVRRPLKFKHSKLHEVITTFEENLEETLSSIYVHDIYCCLGTTMKKAGSQEAFKKIDFSLVVTVAGVMRKQGAEQFVVISAMGADNGSKVFYNRVKGEMEDALRGLGYPCLRILRPSLLLGPREEFRFGERVAIVLSRLLKPFLLAGLEKYKPVEGEVVARFMVKVARQQPVSGAHVYESNLMW